MKQKNDYNMLLGQQAVIEFAGYTIEGKITQVIGKMFLMVESKDGTLLCNLEAIELIRLGRNNHKPEARPSYMQ